MTNDLISREALKEFVNSSIEQATKVGILADADYLWELLNYAIDNAPTVEGRQQGEWIDEVVPVCLVGRGNRQCRCSLCDHRDIQAKTQEVPYCWFCGAEMNKKHITDKEV